MTKPIEKMNDTEFNDWVINHMLEGWIPLKMYLRIFPDEKRGAVDTRVSRGHWKRGVHYHSPEGSGAWVNLKAIREWASGKQAPVG